MRFKNLLTSSRYFSELEDLSLVGLALYAECPRNSPNKLYLPKQMGEDQLDELDEPITLRILDEITLDFTQAKWWMWWKTTKCGGLISSCCPAAVTEKRAMKKEEKEGFRVKKCFYIPFLWLNKSKNLLRSMYWENL